MVIVRLAGISGELPQTSFHMTQNTSNVTKTGKTER
jgi:hypothetical protein